MYVIVALTLALAIAVVTIALPFRLEQVYRLLCFRFAGPMREFANRGGIRTRLSARPANSDWIARLAASGRGRVRRARCGRRRASSQRACVGRPRPLLWRGGAPRNELRRIRDARVLVGAALASVAVDSSSLRLSWTLDRRRASHSAAANSRSALRGAEHLENLDRRRARLRAVCWSEGVDDRDPRGARTICHDTGERLAA